MTDPNVKAYGDHIKELESQSVRDSVAQCRAAQLGRAGGAAVCEPARPSEKMILAGGDVLLDACSSEKGNLRPWKPFDVAQVAIKVWSAMAEAAAPPSGNVGEGPDLKTLVACATDLAENYEPSGAISIADLDAPAPPQPAPDAVREAIIQECIEIAQRYDDCGAGFIVEKLREFSLTAPVPSGEGAAEPVIKSADDWRGTLWRERLRDELHISSDLDHRSWRDIKRAIISLQSSPGVPSGEGTDQ